MAALEYRILSKILQSRTLQDVLRCGLSDDQFKDPEARQIWRFLKMHWHDRATIKTLPSIKAVQNKWASFSYAPLPIEEEADVEAMVRELKLRTFGSDARSLAAYFQELVDETDEEKLEEVVKEMQTHLTTITLQMKQSHHLGVREIIEEAQDHYESALDGQIFGLPWPWECLTQDTLGKRAGDFIVFYARMKQMKTWLMLYCAVHDFLDNNARVLVWSREMSKPKMCLRLASLLAKVDYQRFKNGALPPQVQKRAWRRFEQLMDEGLGDYSNKDNVSGTPHRQMILLCGRDAPKSLGEIQGFIREYQPDVVYLDSFYHIETDNMQGIKQRWHRFAVLSEDVKSMAEDEAIPVIAIHQANRAGDKTFGNTMVDIADTDVLAREADLVGRILKRSGQELHEDDYETAVEQARLEGASRKTSGPKLRRPRIKVPQMVKEEKARERFLKAVEDEEDDAPRVGAELAIVLPGNREGVLDAFTIHAVPGYNFEFISKDYSIAQIEEWIKEDKEADAKKGVPGGRQKSDGKSEKPKFNADTFKTWKSDRGKRPEAPVEKPLKGN